VNRNMENYYYGRVCEKHPELNGLRKKSRRTCPKCASASCTKSYFKRKEKERACQSNQLEKQ